MGLHNLKYLFSTFIGLIVSITLIAQIDLSTHFDVGENNVSDGVYVKNSSFAAYHYQKFRFLGGVRLDIESMADKVFTGTTLQIDREFSIKEFPFEIEGLIIYNPFSDWVYEFNWGLLAKVQRKHFDFKLGTSFRTYSLTSKAQSNSDLDSNNKIHENWNLMYLAQYNLKPDDFKWNVGISITNIDYFLINQEVNPMFNLNGYYKINKPLTLYAETWYKAAGLSNISVNYFGFFIRTGLIWKVDLNK